MPVFLYAMTITYPRKRADQVALERLNRYILRLSTRDFLSSYTDLLKASNSLPVFKKVLYNRIGLCQSYSKNEHFLPDSVLGQPTQDPRFRQRFHGYALEVCEPTGIRYGYSALEVAIQAWNRVPDVILQNNKRYITRRLTKVEYSDFTWTDFVAMDAAIRLL